MRRLVVFGVIGCLTFVAACSGGNAATTSDGGGRGGGRGARPPMPVEFTEVKRADVAARVQIVGNLIGAATVEAVPRVNGRLADVHVRLGDRIHRGAPIAKIEDREIREQVRQAEASFKVAEATIRQREADLKLAKTNLDRNESLLNRQLLPRQTFDDTQARYEAALAQLDLARAQFDQAKARLDELRINLANTVIASPVDGFIAKRYLDPGAAVSPNAPVASVVDIRTVRMIANVVERDVEKLHTGMPARIQVDAFPGETFTGSISRIAPVFDPQTRTAEMEIEIPNPSFRLKPGMYARVDLTVQQRQNTLTVPLQALVNLDGREGVFVAAPGAPAASGQPHPASNPAALTAKFQPVATGIRDAERVEIVSGIDDGTRVITTGATALRDGDRVVPSDAATERRGGGRPGGSPQGGAR